jgi:hypothetical protein
VPRSIRNFLAALVAVTALALAAVPAFAADEPVLSGTVVDAAGQPFPVEDARMTMTGPDGGGLHAAQVEIAADGSFDVALMPWGTAESPAQVTITVTGAVSEVVTNADGCNDSYAPVAESTVDVALESGGEPDPIELVAEPQLIGTVCGAGATPVVTLPPTVVNPVTPAPSVAPVAPVAPVAGGGDSTPWLPLLILAVVVVAVVLGAWRLLASRSSA